MNTLVATELVSEIRCNVLWALGSAGGSLNLSKIREKILTRAPDDASPLAVLATLNAVLENLKAEKRIDFSGDHSCPLWIIVTLLSAGNTGGTK